MPWWRAASAVSSRFASTSDGVGTARIRGGHHPICEVVAPLERPASADAQLAGDEQLLARDLCVRPLPPAGTALAGGLEGLLDVARRHRPALPDDGEHLVGEMPGADPSRSPSRANRRQRSSGSNSDRHERCDMRPGLQQQPVARPVGPRGAVEDGASGRGRAGRRPAGSGPGPARSPSRSAAARWRPPADAGVPGRSALRTAGEDRPAAARRSLCAARRRRRSRWTLAAPADPGTAHRHRSARPTDVPAADGPSTTIGRAPHLVGTASEHGGHDRGEGAGVESHDRRAALLDILARQGRIEVAAAAGRTGRVVGDDPS